MLKRNLIIVAILSLTVVFTSNAFGQWHPEIDRVKTGKPVLKTKSVKSPKDVVSGQASEKTQKSNRRIRPRQPKGMNKADLTEQLSVKQGTTTSQIYGDVHPGTDGMGGVGMVKSQSTTTNQRRTHKPLRRDSVKIRKGKTPAGFMDYTDDAAMAQVQPGQNSGGTISNQVKRNRNINSPRDVASGQATGRKRNP